MARCSTCGKHGLFLKVNSEGLCKKCQEAKEIAKRQYEEQQKSATQNFYNLLSELYYISKEKVSIKSDPIENLKLVATIESRIQSCHRLLDELDKMLNLPYLDTVIEAHLKYESPRDEQIHYAKLHPFGFSMWTHRRDSENTYSQELHSKLSNDINSYITRWQYQISRIQKNAEFETLCRNLPQYPIIQSQESVSLLLTSELDDLVKYSRITAKTSIDRIGNFVVLDTETTGLSSANNEITEVSAIRFEDWTPVMVFHSLVKPQKAIPDEIIQKTGITNEMVSSAPTFSSIVPSLNEFIGKSNIVGHNLPFDLKFLYRNGFNFASQKRKYFDTLDIAKTTLKKPKMKWDREFESYEINFNYDYDVEDYKLSTLCEFFEIRDNSSAHRSTSDALATGILFHNLAQAKIGES